MVARCAGSVAYTALLLVIPACSRLEAPQNRKPVFPVRGEVLVDNKPAVGAFIFFVPLNESADQPDSRPRAQVGADGKFQLSMYGDKDGAPAGEYVVTVLWEGDGGFDKLKGQYRDAAKSRLRATVKEGDNELPPFRLN
jgi:hypothetical protein